VRRVRVDEVVDVLVQFVVGLAVDVDHVTRIVIGKADVLADRGFELHVGDGLFDAVEGRGERNRSIPDPLSSSVTISRKRKTCLSRLDKP